MKKISKYIILSLCLFCFCTFCRAELAKNVSELQAPATTQETPVAETTETEVKQDETVYVDQNTEGMKPSEDLVKNAIKHKVPMGKENILKKFLLAMLCVAGCCAFLYLILILVKKIKKPKNISSRIITDFENTLDTPQNLSDAINIFLDKNKL